MTPTITNYGSRKVAEYLEPGQRYLLSFCHGLGDTLMFIPLVEQLRSLYPASVIEVYLEGGQEGWFGAVTKPIDDAAYAAIFCINFPMAEGSGMTKPELCAVQELGLPPASPPCPLPAMPSPFVGVSFQSTSCPWASSCPAETAAQIWEEIRQAGKLPYEVHFLHCFHNPVNERYACVTASARDAAPPGIHLRNVVGLVQRCWAFVGVLSGPLVVAANVMPGRTLALEGGFKVDDYMRTPIARLAIAAYRPGQVRQWLDGIARSEG